MKIVFKVIRWTFTALSVVMVLSVGVVTAVYLGHQVREHFQDRKFEQAMKEWENSPHVVHGRVTEKWSAFYGQCAWMMPRTGEVVWGDCPEPKPDVTVKLIVERQ